MDKYPKNLISKFFDATASSYDIVVLLATLGQDTLWKKEILRHMTSGNSFLDLACGTGILTRKIAAKFPYSTVVGVDISKSYLDVAVKNSSSFNNIRYIHDDAEKLDIDMKFDCVVSSYVPKYCDSKVLARICLDHLKPGGKIILHDFTYPDNSLIQKLWSCYFLVLWSIGFLVPNWKTAFRELPNVIKGSSWDIELLDEMKSYGMNVELQRSFLGFSSLLFATW